MPNPKAKTKTSLSELLKQHPEPPRNDWSNGRPGGTSSGRQDDDGFPKYDPSAFESGTEEDEDNGPSAGGSFAILAGLNGDSEENDDEWVTVSKAKKKGPAQFAQPAPAAAAPSATAAAPRRPAPTPAAPGPRSVPAAPAAPFPRPIGALGGGPGSAAGPSRAPYSLTSAVAPAPRTPRPQTHDAEGRPISDTYYQTFQKVYRNPAGAVCMRFHKTDVVVVRPNGDLVLTSGGYQTRTTFCTVSEALEPLDFMLSSSLGGEGRGDWSVTCPDGTRLPWQDDMVVPATSEADRGRGARLLAAYGVSAAAVPAVPTRTSPTGPAPAAYGAAAPRAPAPAPAPAPVPAPVPASTWSYRSAAGAGAAATAATGPAAAAPSGYTPHLRPPGAFGAPITAATAAGPSAPAPVPVPAPRSAESLSELREVLDAALAAKDEAAALAATAGGAGAVAPAVAAAAAAPADLDDEHACIACMAAQKSTLLIPCGHMVLCGLCAAQVLERSGVCPMCREAVITTVTLS